MGTAGSAAAGAGTATGALRITAEAANRMPLLDIVIYCVLGARCGCVAGFCNDVQPDDGLILL